MKVRKLSFLFPNVSTFGEAKGTIKRRESKLICILEREKLFSRCVFLYRSASSFAKANATMKRVKRKFKHHPTRLLMLKTKCSE